MNWITRFFKLPLRDKLLLIEAIYYLTRWQLIVKISPFNWYKSFLGNLIDHPTGTNASQFEHNKRIKKAIHSASKYLPWKPVCFPQALTGKSMLKRRGIKTTFYLGAAVGNFSTKVIDLHSWLKCGDQTIAGGVISHQFTVFRIYE